MDEKPNLRPTRTKYNHGATMREEFAVKGTHDKETLQFTRFVYDESSGCHRQQGRSDEFIDAFGFIAGKEYSLNKQGRWEILAQIQKEAESFRRALTEEGEERPSPEETVVVLLENNNNHRHSLSHVPFIRLKPIDSDEEEEYVYRQTRTGRAVEKKNKSSRRASAEQQDIIHEGDVIVYFWESGNKSKKQTMAYRCKCSYCTGMHLDRHNKKKVLMTEALK
ncbi:hypothetical protein QOT17_017188 [Balamuthia mandrillaris]